MYIAVQELHFLPALGKNEVIGEAFAIVQEVILEGVGLIAETQDEVFMSVMGVILHYMPQNWSVPNGNHRFWDLFRILPQPHSQATTKQHHFHSKFSFCTRALIPASTGLHLKSFSCDAFTPGEVLTKHGIVLGSEHAADCRQPGRNLLRDLISLPFDFNEEIRQPVWLPTSSVQSVFALAQKRHEVL